MKAVYGLNHEDAHTILTGTYHLEVKDSMMLLELAAKYKETRILLLSGMLVVTYWHFYYGLVLEP